MKYMSLVDIITHSVRLFAKRPALTMRMGYRTVTLSYTDVERMAQQVAVFLERHGVNHGDRVALCAPNSPYWIAIFWGCLMRGAVLVPLAPQYTSAMLDRIIASAQPKVFFSSANGRYHGLVPTFLVERLPNLIADCDPVLYRVVPHAETDLAEIMYTSGTTGDPKGVMLTHGAIIANVCALRATDCLPVVGEAMLSVLPLSHMLEQTAGFLLPFSAGAHIIFTHSHAAVKELLCEYRITKMVAVPEFLKLMMSRLESGVRDRGMTKIFSSIMWLARCVSYRPLKRLITWPLRRALVTSLDAIASGGSLLDAEIEQFWNDLGITILQGYGLTETSPVVAINTYKHRKVGSLGKVLPNIHVRLSDGGECEVRGPSVFSGYYNNLERTQEVLDADGWFKTGDMLSMDDDGYLFFKGRRKYMIKGPGAQNIFPEDIETVLNHQPGIQDSCVVGITTPNGMLEIHAVVVKNSPEVNEAACVEAANEHLASYQHVTGWSVWVEPDFPRSVTRKIKREVVLEWVQGRDTATTSGGSGAASKLKAIIAEVTGIEIASLQGTTLLGADLKFDSLMRIEFVARVEEIFNVALDESAMTAKTTIDDLETMLKRAPAIKKMPRVKNWPNQIWARAVRIISWSILRCISRLWIRVEVRGLENLQNVKGPVLFMPNHVSLIDGVIVGCALPKAFRKRISFAAAYDVLYEEFKNIRVFVELLSYAFPFPRRESEHVATGLLNMGTMLDKGYNVTFFPEGKVSLDGKLQPLKAGAGLVAVEMGVPVVPIKIIGLEKLVPYDCLLPKRRGVVTVVIGKPEKFWYNTETGNAYQQAVMKIDKALQSL